MASNQNTPSSSTATEISRRRHESKEVDYLSYMPIEILLHIFSFLPLKFWIVMSLVSKRWKYFWTQIPNLELDQFATVKSILKKPSWCFLCDQVHSYNHYDNGCHRHLKKAAANKFMSIVDRILLLHSGCTISRFSLFIDYETLKGYTSRIDTWVDFFRTSNIEKLKLNFSGGCIVPETIRILGLNLNALYRFKDTLFAPKMLKSLTLIGCIFEARVYGVAALKSLKRLSLIDVDINGCRICEILFICPLLEVLKLKRVLFPNNFMICEEELKIKELILIDCMSYSSASFPVDIIAPGLVALTIFGHHMTSCSIKKATNLILANVCVKCVHPNYASDMAALLRDLSDCLYLYLNSWCIQVLPPRDNLTFQLPPEFQNLVYLRLEISMTKQELPGLAYLISCCPKLETLNLLTDQPQPADFEHFEFIQNASDIEEDNYWESKIPFRFHCLKNSLKKVDISEFGGRIIEMQTVKFLLQNAVVLEELNLSLSRLPLSASNEQNHMRIMHYICGLIMRSKKASPHVCVNVSSCMFEIRLF